MNPVYQSAFLKALGWSLIDSLWQIGALWFLYILVTRNGKKYNSSARYLLALITLFIGTAAFAVSVIYNASAPARAFSFFSSASFLSEHLPLISGSYLIIASYYIVRWIYQYSNNKGLLKNAEPMGIELATLVEQLRHITAFTREIKIWCSSTISTPLTTGFIRPVILLPVAALTQLSTKQVEALIVHEFFHIKRNDYLVNLLISLAEAFLFFNPFAKLLLKSIHQERENCCDDEVIRLGYDRWEYAHALYILSKNNQQQYRFALAATGDEKHVLLNRVKRLLKTGYTSYSLKKPLAIFFLCLFAAGSMTNMTVGTYKIDISKTVSVMYAKEQTANPLPWRGGRVGSNLNSSDPATRPRWVTEKPILKIKSAPKPPPPPTPAIIVEYKPDEQTNAENISGGESHTFYVSANTETIAFSMIEAPISTTEKPLNTDPTQPFVPNSAFYFPDHELSVTVNGKKTISL